MNQQDLQTLSPQELQDMQRALDEQLEENKQRRRMVRDELIRRGPLAPDVRPAPAFVEVPVEQKPSLLSRLLRR